MYIGLSLNILVVAREIPPIETRKWANQIAE
jgi:hypothetical protein